MAARRIVKIPCAADKEDNAEVSSVFVEDSSSSKIGSSVFEVGALTETVIDVECDVEAPSEYTVRVISHMRS